MRLGIIGATGWLGSALCRSLVANGLGPAMSIVLLNRSGSRPSSFDHPGMTWASGVADLVDQVDAIVVSVRPEDFVGLHLHAPGRLVVSLMAGVPLRELTQMTGARVVRAMPNAAAERGRSYTPWLAAAEVSETDRAIVRDVLAMIGTEDEVAEETEIDYLTGLSGSGAAFPALLAAAMLADARARGLPEQVLRRAVEAVVCDGADTLRDRIEQSPAMVETYRAYRGTTSAALDAAEEAGFSRAVSRGLEAAARKARRMWPHRDPSV